MPIREDVLAKPVNVSKVVYQVLQTKMATYVELNTVLSLEDALDILEVDQVAKHNESVFEELRNAANS